MRYTANQFVGGRLREGMETATQVLAMALSTGDPMLEVTGRHASSYTRYYRAEYGVALEEAEAGLRQYSFDREMMIAEIFQLSPSACKMRISRARETLKKRFPDETK